MTLCIAAACGSYKQHAIVYAWDAREENQFVGSDIAFKVSGASKTLLALMSGEGSAPEDYLATCRSTLPDSMEPDESYDQLNKAVAIHKQKLAERLSQKRFGISYERLLTKGQQEIPAENRDRFFYDLERLDPGYEVIVFGFLKKYIQIYIIDGYTVRSCNETFGAVGSGAIVAETVLYQRKQESSLTVDQTLYNVYEACRLAGGAPGVGKFEMAVIDSTKFDERGFPESRYVGDHGKAILEKTFQKFGPRNIKQAPEFGDSAFY